MILKYSVHVVFGIFLAYFGLLAFVFDKDPIINKMMMVIVAGVWLLWIFAKSMLKIVLITLIVGSIGFACYYVLHAPEIECKKSGREWNKKEQLCEDKKTVFEKIKNSFSDIMGETVKQWVSENIKIETTKEKK